MNSERIMEHLYRVAWWDMAGQDVVNCDVYAIDCGETVVLIDAGLGGSSYPIMKENLIYWGLWERVSVCLLTHLHKDHAGGVTRLQAEGVQVWGGEGASAYAQNEKARAYFEGNVPQLDRVLTAGECFTLGTLTFQILATPGHTSACVTYLVTIDNIRCAFTGDLVMPNGTIGYAGSFDYDRELLKGSLQHVLQYDFDALLTGHMLHSTQPEGFWLHDGKSHVLEVLRAGNDGKW